MKYRYSWLVIILLIVHCSVKQRNDYPIKPIPVMQVKLGDRFWQPRLEINRRITIPHCFHKLHQSGVIDNFSRASHLMRGAHQGRPSGDADLYKTMEGAYYAYPAGDDSAVSTLLDSLCILIAAAQEEDGYLYTARSVDPKNPHPSAGPERWSQMYKSHELFNMGHLYESAVATGYYGRKELLLDVARKSADLIDCTFGRDKNQGVPGHQEIEIGLVKLYRLTGEKKYLELACYFLEARGRHKREIVDDSVEYYQYNQNDKPVKNQTTAVGHAVRGTYMYSAMADVAALNNDHEYKTTLEMIWRDIVYKKMYITGSIGSTDHGESMGETYCLPNDTAYNETCAAIGFALFNYRMFLLHGDGRYLDIFERIIYNGLLSGVGLSGDLFFYLNPLESDGKYLFNKGKATRQEWFNCPCCPTNIARFLPTIPGFIYAQDPKGLYINLFIASSAIIPLSDNQVKIVQETEYPWDGRIKICLTSAKPELFAIKIHIPGWARNQPVPGYLYRNRQKTEGLFSITVNRQAVSAVLKNGFAVLHRKWQTGDSIEVSFPMPVRQMLAQKEVVADSGKMAIERGPLVYCAEEADNSDLTNLHISDRAEFSSEYHQELLRGITLIRTEGLLPSGIKKEIVLIPYSVWANRGVGRMAVWLPGP